MSDAFIFPTREAYLAWRAALPRPAADEVTAGHVIQEGAPTITVTDRWCSESGDWCDDVPVVVAAAGVRTTQRPALVVAGVAYPLLGRHDSPDPGDDSDGVFGLDALAERYAVECRQRGWPVRFARSGVINSLGHSWFTGMYQPPYPAEHAGSGRLIHPVAR